MKNTLTEKTRENAQATVAHGRELPKPFLEFPCVHCCHAAVFQYRYKGGTIVKCDACCDEIIYPQSDESGYLLSLEFCPRFESLVGQQRTATDLTDEEDEVFEEMEELG